MKKAVITAGSHQYIVQKDDVINVDIVGDKKSLTFDSLMVIDGDKVAIGTPFVEGSSVKATVVSADEKADKVVVMKFRAKKREKTKRGHRQHYSRIQITDIL